MCVFVVHAHVLVVCVLFCTDLIHVYALIFVRVVWCGVVWCGVVWSGVVSVYCPCVQLPSMFARCARLLTLTCN